MASTSSASPSSHAPPALRVNGQEDQIPTGERAALRKTMFQKLRPYPLRHEWVFWHDKFVQQPTMTDAGGYEDQLKMIAEISTVQSFWQVFNNFPFPTLQIRDSLHLFKQTVKPLWEDPRNARGGAWTFRVGKSTSLEFWKEILMMAIGEVLQEVVEKGDDICGVSISVRFNSHLIMIWNRDGSNEKSIDAILKTVLDGVPEEIRPAQTNYYYKKHSEHKGFQAPEEKADGGTAKPQTEQTTATPQAPASAI